MARLFELLIGAIILYLAFRRIAAPIQRGYNERDRERQEHKQRETSVQSKLDRASARDAEFKDIP